MNSQWEKIGDIFVDAGLCWVGDPCYVLGDKASHRVRDWGEFCDKLASLKVGEGWKEALGEGVGFAVDTGYGDGQYPVYVKRTTEGRIAQLKVKFI